MQLPPSAHPVLALDAFLGQHRYQQRIAATHEVRQDRQADAGLRRLLLGDHAGAAEHDLIFRTSWVYAARGGNFAKTMLRLAGQRDELKVVADQFGAPTSAELIADVTAQALQRLRWDAELAARASGTYHLVASGETSWHLYARFVIEQALERGWELQATPQRVLPIATEDYPVPAKRPANSRLDNHKLQQVFGLVLPDWRYHAGRMIQELSEQGPL